MNNEQLLTIINHTRIVVKDLSERLEVLENLSSRVAAIESDLEQLRELLKELSETGPNNEREFRGWEISLPLIKWATSDD